MKLHKFVLILTLLFLFIGIAHATDISSCTTITESGSYKLTQSIYGYVKDICINIQADNVELDCAGYSITDEKAEETSGVYTKDHSNITIKNCIISKYYYGIHFRNAKNVNIINNIISQNSNGIQLDHSSNVNIKGNSVNNNSWAGIYLYDVNESIIENNNANGNWNGIFLLSSNLNNLINNTANYNNRGFYILDSNSNKISKCTADNNKETGIYFDKSNNNIFSDCSASNNANLDIYISRSANNDFTNQILTNSTPVSFTVKGEISLKGANLSLPKQEEQNITTNITQPSQQTSEKPQTNNLFITIGALVIIIAIVLSFFIYRKIKL